MAQSYVKAADLPQVIPVFPLAGAIVLPRGQLPLNIFEPPEKQALLEAPSLLDRSTVLTALMTIDAAGDNGEGEAPQMQ